MSGLINPSIALSIEPPKVPSPTELIQEKMNALAYQRAQQQFDEESAVSNMLRQYYGNGQSEGLSQQGNLMNALAATKYGREVGGYLTQQQQKQKEIQDDVLKEYASGFSTIRKPEEMIFHYQKMKEDPRLDSLHKGLIDYEIQRVNDVVANNQWEPFLKTKLLGIEKAAQQHFNAQNLGGVVQTQAIPSYVLPGETPEAVVVEGSKQMVSKSPNAPQTIVNVDNRKANQEFGKKTAEDIVDEGKVLRKSASGLTTLRKMKEIIPQLKPGYVGKGADARLAFVGLLRDQLGVDIGDAKQYEKAETLKSFLNQNISTIIKQIDPTPSDATLKLAKDAVGNIDKDPNALMAVLSDLEDKVKFNVEDYNRRVVEMRKNGVPGVYDMSIQLPKEKPKSKILAVNGKATNVIPKTLAKGDVIKMIGRNNTIIKARYNGGDPRDNASYSEVK